MSIRIIPAGQGDIADAGRVHTESWRESHRAFCSPTFVALHTARRQAMYLSDKLARGARLYLLRLRRKNVASGLDEVKFELQCTGGNDNVHR